ncbi:MAG: UvrD-helicase domain-containing protein [Chloroflexota bacterium]
MSQGTLTIYNASAGSGKTYTLTGIYLLSLFRSRYNYRKILAVTFTNKATAEMKSRILENLHKLTAGEKCEYLAELVAQSGKTEEWIRKEAGDILKLILHDFSRFSVSTIDSFFQKILRAFAREAGLHSGYNIDLDLGIWLNAAIDEMISSAASDKQLRDWLISYAISNIDNEKSWNLKSGIMRLSWELFNEKFRILSGSEMHKLADKEFLTDYIAGLKNISSAFENHLKETGRKAAELIASYQLTDEMFYRKGQGIPKYVRQLAGGEITEPGCYVREIMNEPPRWSTDKIKPSLQEAINAGLGDMLQGAIAYYDKNIVAYRTSKVIAANIYALGILTDIMENIRKLTSSENTFLLSDAGEFLRLITEGDQCPFIYEKTGNTFENFMIDEFQDTSMIQWKNFDPLISNSRAQGFDNLVVGDIKQSIYRWRNSDWRILRSLTTANAEDQRVITRPLDVNWRSRSNIIKFNNSLFSVLPSLLDKKLENDSVSGMFNSLYAEAEQKDPGRKEGGYVRIGFIESTPEKSWEAAVLEKLPSIIENLQEKGYSPSDTGIIVRDGRQGAMVLRTLIDYSNNLPAGKKEKFNFNVVSNDSLLLSGSPAVCLIISVLSFMNDPSDMVSKAAIHLYSHLAAGDTENEDLLLTISNTPEDPEGFDDFLASLRQKPLFESVEQIISFFNLGDHAWNAVWLNAFQDCVMGFVKNGNPDIKSFLEWWEASGQKKSVTLPGNQDAIRILTIHKSKGLEYSAVILPFISWELDHPPMMQPLLWVRPQTEPFNELGIVPVRCCKELTGTIFAEHYLDEKHSIYLDNLNLLYVATTRARDVLIGFAPAAPKSGSIASVLRDAFEGNSDSLLSSSFDPEINVFEYGDIPDSSHAQEKRTGMVAGGYPVSYASRSLKLKLHGENYFSAGDEEKRKRINYGKIMHEVFEGINVPGDVHAAVRRLVLEGKLPEAEAPGIENRVSQLISEPEVAEWFSEGNTVMNEAGILLTSGNTRRPDRVIMRNGRTTIVDFKFGSESDRYLEQIGIYRGLLSDMGYKDIDACIWYVDKNKIVYA